LTAKKFSPPCVERENAGADGAPKSTKLDSRLLDLFAAWMLQDTGHESAG